MFILDWKAATPDARRKALERPAAESRAEVRAQAAEIVAAVRAEGDAAVRRLTPQQAHYIRLFYGEETLHHLEDLSHRPASAS